MAFCFAREWMNIHGDLRDPTMMNLIDGEDAKHVRDQLQDTLFHYVKE
jgi:hypothetical protein